MNFVCFSTSLLIFYIFITFYRRFLTHLFNLKVSLVLDFFDLMVNYAFAIDRQAFLKMYAAGRLIRCFFSLKVCFTLIIDFLD